MNCPFCSSTTSRVTDKRESPGGIRRRRECLKCKKRFTTYEKIEKSDIYVIKKDGRREVFDREKLKRGLTKATWKRAVSISDIEKLIDDVERKLMQRKSTEVRSWEVGKLVLNRLKKLDVASYMAFASVYHNFRDINDYEQMLKEVEKENGLE